MLEEVTSAINWKGKLPFGEFILIQDCVEADGSFLIHHMINECIKNEVFVCVLGFSQTLQHYTSISKKLGSSILAAEKKNQFIFLDYFLNGFSWCDKKNVDLLNLDDLKLLFDKIEEIQTSKSNVCFIIDDLPVLKDSCDNAVDVLDFLKYFSTILSNKHILLALDQQLEEDGEDVELKLQTEIKFVADTVIKVEPLDTGYSKDIHGKLSVSSGSRTKQNHTHEFLHFQVHENGVKTFVPGSH